MYTLNITNESQMDQTFIVFQKPPVNAPNVHSLAWKTVTLHSGMTYRFDWQKDYSFIASTVGDIRPGIIVHPASMAPAYLPGENEAVLEPNMMFNTSQGGAPDTFTIQTSREVQPDFCGVGLSMSGSSLFITPAIPGYSAMFSVPGNEFFVGYGNYQEGEVIDFQRLVPSSARVNFQGPGEAINVTLEANGSFNVQ